MAPTSSPSSSLNDENDHRLSLHTDRNRKHVAYGLGFHEEIIVCVGSWSQGVVHKDAASLLEVKGQEGGWSTTGASSCAVNVVSPL